MNIYAQSLVSGLMSGAVYALLGIGLVIVYRTSRILNLAHGEAYAAAGITTASCVAYGLPLPLAVLAGLAAAVLLSLALYRFILRPREDWPMPTLVLVTLGVAFLMRGAFNLAVGPDPVSFPVFLPGAPLRLFGGIMPRQGIALVVVGLVLSVGVALFLRYSRIGKELQATAENPRAAQLLGVNVERARLVAFALSGLLAGAAAALLLPLVSVDFQTGMSMTLRGFIAAAIAGMSPARVVPAGFLLGLFEAAVGTLLGALYQDPVMFGILIAISLWQSRSIRFGAARRA
jgi:branched-chain amino acid transport system permease protein